MRNNSAFRHTSVVLNKHEFKLHERRQERQAETRRLDGLKKVLHAKLQESARAQSVRVA